MSRPMRKPIATEDEIKTEMEPASEAPGEALKVRESTQLVTKTGSLSNEMKPAIAESSIQPETEPGGDQVESMQLDSMAARWVLEHKSVLRELHRAVVRQIIFYTKPEGGGLTMEEAIQSRQNNGRA